MLKCQTYRNPQREVKTHLCMFQLNTDTLTGVGGMSKIWERYDEFRNSHYVVYHPPQIEQHFSYVNFDVLV